MAKIICRHCNGKGQVIKTDHNGNEGEDTCPNCQGYGSEPVCEICGVEGCGVWRHIKED